MAKVFISFRRSDSGSSIGRIYERMVNRYGRNNVFRDVNAIVPGADILDFMEKVLRQCQVELVFIGPRWLDSRAQDGSRRLDDPHDLVRVEIEMANRFGLAVVPVLIGGARMPTSEELPESLRFLAMLLAIEVREDLDFSGDIKRLFAVTERSAADRGGTLERIRLRARILRRPLLTAIAVSLLAIGAVISGVNLLSRGVIGLSGLNLWNLIEASIIAVLLLILVFQTSNRRITASTAKQQHPLLPTAAGSRGTSPQIGGGGFRGSPPPRVFVSHSHKDDDVTFRLVEHLRTAGVQVWVDVADIRHGSFMQRINEALTSTEWLILVQSPDALSSPAVRMEVDAAINLALHGEMREVIPFIIRKCDPKDVPPTWRVLHFYDATRNYETALAGLLRAIGIIQAQEMA